MKLSTKKLFSNEKLIPKNKLSSKNTFQTSSNKAKINPRRSKKLNTYINKGKLTTKLNQLNQIPNTNTNAIKRKQKKIRTNNLSCKTQRFDYFDYTKMNDFLNNTEEISDFNNLASTLESESIKQRNEPFDVEKLCDEFKNSALRSTFIIDYDGNNYVNFEQKKIIEDYFDKKKNLENNINKCKINTIKVQEYHTNDISSKGIINDCLYSQNLNKIENINIQSNNNNINNVNKKRKIPLKFVPLGNRLGIGRRMLSTKINQNMKILLNDENDKNNKNDNNNDELKNNNSLFENYNDKSMDSSFLDSSIGEELVKTIL